MTVSLHVILESNNDMLLKNLRIIKKNKINYRYNIEKINEIVEYKNDKSDLEEWNKILDDSLTHISAIIVERSFLVQIRVARGQTFKSVIDTRGVMPLLLS